MDTRIKLSQVSPTSTVEPIWYAWNLDLTTETAFTVVVDSDGQFAIRAGGGTVAWDDITGKPSTFPPTLPISWNDISDKPSFSSTVTLTGDVTGTGTGTVPATISANAVTYGKMQNAGSAGVLVGSPSTGTALQDISLGSGLEINGGTLSATSASAGTLWVYQAKTTATSGYPGNGHILWNNSTQTSATNLLFSHITNDDLDIDLILSSIGAGRTLILQDSDDSANFQKWFVTGSGTNTNSGLATSYWTFPVTLVSSGGTGSTGFSNNHILGIFVLGSGLYYAGGDLTGTYPNPTIIASVALTGTPTAPTAALSTSTTQIATTAFVMANVVRETKNDYVASTTTNYVGNAPSGSATTASVWTIYRTILASDGTVTSNMVASNVKWTDRYTATYT